MSSQARWIKSKAEGSLNPVQVEKALSEITSGWDGSLPDFLHDFPLGEEALIHLLAVSQICAERLQRDPGLLRWLARPEISMSDRGPRRMLAELHGNSESIAAENFRPLRLWKAREMTRIALREVAESSALEDTTVELSCLAGVCLATVYEECATRLCARAGTPATEFTILGLGKLGGRELNHSSDIDLIFLYGEEGQVSPRFTNHEWHNRLVEQIVKSFSGGEPNLFRLDLRLRPEGSAGPLARSLESMENYYAGFGETWERLALIKARGIAGSRELAYEFLRQHQPFIYPKSGTPDLLEEIANIKRRIERDIVGSDKLHRDVKLGIGGIREIEFIVQALQLINGARHPFLQEPSMLKALQALRQLNFLPHEEVLALDNTYRFLRRVEHRLQIEAEQQTHTVPEEQGALGRLARSLRFSSAEDFTAALQARMGAVRPIFQRIISETPAELAKINLEIFNDPKRAAKALGDLERGPGRFHVAPRTRQIARKLHPILLDWLAKAADPDATLNQFVRFVEAYGLRSLLFELVVANRKLLGLVVKTFDASRFAGDLLVRRPQLLEEITRDPTFSDARSIAEHLRRLDSLGMSAFHLDPVRAYRQRQILRTMLRDVLHSGRSATSKNFGPELSDLAEACLLFTIRLLAGKQLTVIALGKFGGHELSYGADLDVLFVGLAHSSEMKAGEEVRAAQNLVVNMAQPTSEGNIWVLDARLRPEGEKGPLVCPLETYQTYYESRAQLGEIHALTRARPVTGPLGARFIQMAQHYWRKASRRPDLFEQIDNMLERIRRERGSGSDFLDFKTWVGGLNEAECLVQALQMRENIWEPNWERAVDQLRERGILNNAEAARVKKAYGLLRRYELALRRYQNKAVSGLPRDPGEERKVSVRLGYDDFESFRRDYLDARGGIHALYEQHIKPRRGD